LLGGDKCCAYWKVRENKSATVRVVTAEKARIVFRDAELAAEWPVAEGENPNLLYGSVHPLLQRTGHNDLGTRESVERPDEEGDVCSS
jgi:hypothetical protein